jgi:hypothetical protein
MLSCGAIGATDCIRSTGNIRLKEVERNFKATKIGHDSLKTQLLPDKPLLSEDLIDERVKKSLIAVVVDFASISCLR